MRHKHHSNRRIRMLSSMHCFRDPLGETQFVRFDEAGGSGGTGGDGSGGGAGGDGGDGGGGSGGDGGGDGGKTFDEAYVKKLRDEAAAHRKKAKDLETKLEGSTKETTAKILQALGINPDPNKNAEEQIAEANKKALEAITKANNRLIDAEIRDLAKECKDVKLLLQVIDRSKIEVKDDDSIEGVSEALEAAYKNYPLLKGEAGEVGGGSRPGAEGSGSTDLAAAGKMTMAQYIEWRKKQQQT